MRVTLPGAVTRGDLLAVYVEWNGKSPASISDNQGNHWADPGKGRTQWVGQSKSQVLYAGNVADGTTTVTVKFDTWLSASLYVHEYSGIDRTDPVDRAAVARGSGVRLGSPSIGTTQYGDLLLAGGTAQGSISNGGSGFVIQAIHAGDIVEDRIAGAAGRYWATARMRGFGHWVMNVVAFKAASRDHDSPSSRPTTSPTSSTPTRSTATAPHSSPRTTPTSTARTTPYPASAKATPSSPGSSSSTAPRPPTGSRVGCALPAFPSASCTGVPPGTQLSDYTGPCTITASNTVIDSETINCSQLTVRAANVTIKNSKVNTNIWLDQDQPNSDSWSMTITDSEVDGGKHQIPTICCGNYTVQRVNSHGGQNGAQCENGEKYCTIIDSYLHGQYMPPGADWHLGGFLSDGSDNITLTHNYIVCDHPVDNGEGCTGDINLIPNFASISGALIESNLLGANTGSAFCTYGGEKTQSPTPHSNHVVYRNNVFERGINNKCADYGPVTAFAVNNPGNQWLNNRWDDGGLVNPVN